MGWTNALVPFGDPGLHTPAEQEESKEEGEERDAAKKRDE